MKKFSKEGFKTRIKNHHLYRRARENKLFALLLIILILLISYSYFSNGIIYELLSNDLQDLTSLINSFGKLSAFVFIALIIIETVLAPIPGIIINAAGGITFGPWLATLLLVIGNFIGASICFFIAKRFGGFYFEKLIGVKRLAQFQKYSEKYGALVLFILRLNPITSSDLFSYLAGFIEMSYKKFILATMLGLIPSLFIQSYFGDFLIKESPFLKLFFLLITLIYLLIFFYGIYKISKEKFKTKLSNFRK